MIDDEEALLTQILALLLPPLIFGTIPKYFDIAVYTFLSSSPELMITYTCWPIQYLFFLSALWLLHNHFWVITV